MMTDTARKDWLSSLKEGDKVAYDYARYGGERSYTIKAVKKITPTGKIRLDDDNLFDEKGEHRSGTGWHRTYYTIVPVTQEIKDSIRRKSVLYTISQADFKKLPLDKLEEIMKIIT